MSRIAAALLFASLLLSTSTYARMIAIVPLVDVDACGKTVVRMVQATITDGVDSYFDVDDALVVNYGTTSGRMDDWFTETDVTDRLYESYAEELGEERAAELQALNRESNVGSYIIIAWIDEETGELTASVRGARSEGGIAFGHMLFPEYSAEDTPLPVLQEFKEQDHPQLHEKIKDLGPAVEVGFFAVFGDKNAPLLGIHVLESLQNGIVHTRSSLGEDQTHRDIALVGHAAQKTNARLYRIMGLEHLDQPTDSDWVLTSNLADRFESGTPQIIEKMGRANPDSYEAILAAHQQGVSESFVQVRSTGGTVSSRRLLAFAQMRFGRFSEAHDNLWDLASGIANPDLKILAYKMKLRSLLAENPRLTIDSPEARQIFGEWEGYVDRLPQNARRFVPRTRAKKAWLAAETGDIDFLQRLHVSIAPETNTPLRILDFRGGGDNSDLVKLIRNTRALDSSPSRERTLEAQRLWRFVNYYESVHTDETRIAQFYEVKSILAEILGYPYENYRRVEDFLQENPFITVREIHQPSMRMIDGY